MSRQPRHTGAVAAIAALALAFVAACGSNVTTPGPTASPAPTSSPGPSSTPSGGPTAVPTDPGTTPTTGVPSQTDTDWGRIWDALPPSFPTYPGASPTETGEGPATAILDLGEVAPAEAASFYETALRSAGLGTIEAVGPAEDGSWTVEVLGLEVFGRGTCRIRVTIAPLGTTAIATILYGADCPFE